MVSYNAFKDKLIFFKKIIYCKTGLKAVVAIRSNIDEVIRAVLNSLFFFTKRFYTHILTKHKI